MNPDNDPNDQGKPATPTPPEHSFEQDATPATQMRALAALAGVDAGEDGPVTPVVRILPDLNVTARLMGQVVAGRDLFRQNGELVFFDHIGERQMMTPVRFRSWVNENMIVADKFDKETGEPIPGMLTKDAAGTIMESQPFLRGVRPLAGMNPVRLPVVRQDGTLELLPYGYDEETGIFTVDSGVQYDMEMDIEAAKGWLRRIFGAFPLADERSWAVQVAALLSLYVRHLPGGGSLRPGFLWLANKPESGKSVQAKAAQYPVLGRAPAVKMKKGEQLDKEMEAFMIAGVPSIFLDNVYGGIESATIDQMLTSEESEGRGMGGHGLFRARNTAVLYVTGNRLQLNADAERRFLVVDLFEKGDPAERGIPAEEVLDDTTMKTTAWRARMLSICYSFVHHWHQAGMPDGSVVRGSFETYSRMLGGIVEAAGYENPFQRAEIPDAINPEAAEFIDLLTGVFEEMGGEGARDFTIEDLARIARARQIYEAQVGTADEGRRLTIKRDGIPRENIGMATDLGYMTSNQNSSFGWAIKKRAADEVKIHGRTVRFGKRSQARKSSFTVVIV